MTFKEMSLQDTQVFSMSGNREKSLFASFMGNISPLMKLWFAVMAANLVMLLFLT